MAKAKEKAVNYTAEQIERLKAVYTGADNKGEVAALSAELGKAEPSIRAKLASLGLYVAADKASVKSDRVTKEALVDQIGAIVGLNEAEREGLAKATKTAIEKVLAKLA
jgi:hypothetical protein